MRRKKRNVAREIIDDLKELHATLKGGIPLRKNYTVRTVYSASVAAECELDSTGKKGKRGPTAN
jgi:hypothetical protein